LIAEDAVERGGCARGFKETIQARIKKDPAFRNDLFREGVEFFLSGDLETAKAILSDCINATVGFEKPSNLTQKPAKSLMRMFGPKGNPRARNLFEVIGYLQRAGAVRLGLPPIRSREKRAF
jgi:hypothetical protein